MERRLTYFEAADWREMGFTVTQLTDTATSLHATELYRIGVAQPELPPEPPVTTRTIEGSWDSVFAPDHD